MTHDESKKKSKSHIVLTSHTATHTAAHFKIKWNAETPKERGPVIASLY